MKLSILFFGLTKSIDIAYNSYIMSRCNIWGWADTGIALGNIGISANISVSVSANKKVADMPILKYR